MQIPPTPKMLIALAWVLCGLVHIWCFCVHGYKRCVFVILFTDFYFRATQLTHDEAIHNITMFASFADANLPPCTFHIFPEVLTNRDIMSSLNANMLALLARLYYFFEAQAHLTMNEDKPVTAGVSQRTSSGAELKLSAGCELSSVNDVPRAKIPFQLGKRKLLPLRCRLSSLMSSKAVLTGDDPNKHVTVITPSLSKSLSSFSSPTLTSANVTCKPSVFRSHSLTTPTTTNFEKIGSKMWIGNISEIKRNDVTTFGGRRKENQKECGKDIQSLHLSPEEHTSSDGAVLAELNTTTIVHSLSFNQPIKALERCSPICCSEVQRSFTLSTKHTAASASEAGIPIIQSQQIVPQETSRLACGSTKQHSQHCESNGRLIKPDPTMCKLPRQTNSSTVIIYTPRRHDKGEIVFEQYLLRHVKNENTSEEGNIERWMWRQRLKERYHMHKAACACSFDSAAKINIGVTHSIVASSHPIPSEQLASTTSKAHAGVAAAPLLHDPKTRLPLTPIFTTPGGIESMKTPVDQGKRNPWSLTTYTPNTPHKQVIH